MSHWRKRSTVGLLLFFVFVTVWTSCQSYSRNSAHKEVSTESIRKGEALASVYCRSCHLVPDPALLDSRSWEKGVLPEMGPRLGIFNHDLEKYPSSRRDTNVSKNFYPSAPLLSDEEWQYILDYYIATSPDSLPGQPRHRPIRNSLSLFRAEIPAGNRPTPATSLVKMDIGPEFSGLWVFDVHYKNLYLYNARLEQMDSVPDKGAIADIARQNGTASAWTVCNMGIMNPNNGKFGTLQTIVADAGNSSAGRKFNLQLDTLPIFDRLARPVQLSVGDLNQDGRPDFVVCEFGNLMGALSWLENKGSGQFERHIIRNVPGAIRAYIGDFNGDGKPDIVALFAQGDEGIFLFTNDGKGQFREQVLLRFPPVYGSSYFELADFNNDGHPDILYTCGDNADYSPVLKPYHGVYIFINDGHFHFTQQYFFPINGCYKAMARDFDGDGDLDIAAISYFPDYLHQPEESFVYLENIGSLDFMPYSLPEAQKGKWLVMDEGDLDGDGRPDLVLGNFSPFNSKAGKGVDFKKGPPFLFLKNCGSGFANRAKSKTTP